MDSKNMDLYLFIGQSNMAARAPISQDDTGEVAHTFLLNGRDEWEAAKFDRLPGEQRLQGYNRYSTIETPRKANGFSCGYSFASTIVKEIPDIKLGLIFNAVGGSSISEWQAGAGTGYFEEGVRRAKIAMKSGALKGILWHQGEGDSKNPESYLSDLQKFVRDLRNALGVDESVPFIASELLRVDKYCNFNKVIVDIAQKVPNSDYIDSDKIRDIGDNTHLNVTGQLILGMRYAQKILDKVYDRKIIPTMPESRPESPAKRYPIEFCGDRLAPEYFAIVIGDRIFIPATKIFELLGAEIVWNYPVQQADVTAQNLHVTFGIGNENAAINGAPSALDVAPVIINEKAMVPAEFVEECFPVKAQLLENDIFSIARL